MSADERSLGPAFFDDLYRRDPDPWGYRHRWYEQRKYDLTLAALPRPRYDSAFEAGCSIGVLTPRLAARCQTLLAADISEVALTEARRAVVEVSNVRVERRVLPEEWPAGPFDLVVFSEIGYWLGTDGLPTAIERMVASARPGADIVAVHWRPRGKVYALAGDDVHDALRQHPQLSVVGSYREDAFLLDVLRVR
jgi:SAM-dependent methyltransferase